MNTTSAEPVKEIETKKSISKSMKAYLERAREHDNFMAERNYEYQIGKRHLANMMGEDPETFTQKDVDVCSLYVRILNYIICSLRYTLFFFGERTVNVFCLLVCNYLYTLHKLSCV